ncbi:hypothetical protein [Bacteroides sp. UBA939]|uniref:hypothetical protein n=1 Tax=Bacteroides sp. UBA939 TaxID=1946092 RepID=UPI0025BEE2A7|nr:hypothetical protein [Bacteroides sp. UBA939]
MKKIHLAIGVAILFTSCKCNLTDKSYSVFIDNKSEFVISSYLALGGKGETAYPDTSLLFERKCVGYATKPGSRADQALPTFTYEEWFAMLPQDTLSIFIFNQEVLNNYSWEQIQQDYNILQRYDLSLEDFYRLSDKNDNPVITYPPTEAMRNMKMYPPYSQ